jgi:hypothetical protein
MNASLAVAKTRRRVNTKPRQRRKKPGWLEIAPLLKMKIFGRWKNVSKRVIIATLRQKNLKKWGPAKPQRFSKKIAALQPVRGNKSVHGRWVQCRALSDGSAPWRGVVGPPRDIVPRRRPR